MCTDWYADHSGEGFPHTHAKPSDESKHSPAGDSAENTTARFQSTCQYNTIQYNTIQYNTKQYNTIQYNTIQYNIIILIET